MTRGSRQEVQMAAVPGAAQKAGSAPALSLRTSRHIAGQREAGSQVCRVLVCLRRPCLARRALRMEHQPRKDENVWGYLVKDPLEG